ncbi:MAG: aminomethyl-transferring glycine dehydrogenase subunit GcvPB [Spirochaetia bacterium]|jgi:glycine dehydrogenase subunit 2|nr:aminomethyl-transferring glycine dehydrogenase subunit GcvPB [Spirochaetia bacterium]
MEIIFNKSKKGKNSYAVPQWKGKDYQLDGRYTGNTSLLLPDVGESELVRHYVNLSKKNFCVDENMYPLGSCTMKYNPKINEKLASDPGFTSLHPHCDCESSQGALKIIYELEEYLKKITGMKGVTLLPAAGSHGELTGVMLIKKHFEKTGENRDTIIIPDSAHGTNPASVAMCGFKLKEVKSTPEGDVDIKSLEGMIDKNTAGMMLTSPGTTGLFDRNIKKIAKMLHDNGSLFYGDGANLNATLGKARFADMGFDIMHMNLHKTFSTPHGGGGPGAGPVAVVESMVKYLPVPRVVKKGGQYSFETDFPDTIGRIHSFAGNFLIYLRAYVYIRLLGASGLKDVSETAVLNANYLLALLKDEYNWPIKRRCMHEFIINDKGFPSGITTDHISKRILDYGFHAPTVFFPLIVEHSMMIEPTETENRETLEKFADVMITIKKEAFETPAIVLDAPHNTPIRRADVVQAARTPVLKWE